MCHVCARVCTSRSCTLESADVGVELILVSLRRRLILFLHSSVHVHAFVSAVHSSCFNQGRRIGLHSGLVARSTVVVIVTWMEGKGKRGGGR